LAEHGRALEGLLGSQVDLAATVRELEALAQAGDDSAGLAEAIGQLRAAAQEVGEVLAHPAVEGAAFEQSAQRLQTASEKISAAVGGRKSAKSERAQKAIADVLDELDIQLVVTGEGGQATAVTDRLKRTITFWDPAKSPAPPLRPPRRRLKRK
jgi:hypothetical protein